MVNPAQDFSISNNRMTVTVTGISELSRGILNTGKWDQQYKETMNNIAKMSYDAVYAATPQRTGKTAGGWKVKQNNDGFDLVNNWRDQKGNLVVYFLMTGSKAITITPVGKKALTNQNSSSIAYYNDFGRDGRPRPWANRNPIAPNRALVDLIQGQALAEMAGEIAADNIIGFFSNQGTIQRRSAIGRFGAAVAGKVGRRRR